MSDETKAPEPIGLSPEEQRESERRDALIMRKLDKRLGIKKEPVQNILLELNKRLSQYRTQFQIFSFEFLIMQTIQDFIAHVLPLQKYHPKKKLNPDKALGIERESQKEIVVVGEFFEYRK